MLATDDLIDRLQPWKEEVRKNLFGSSDRPFSSKKAMADWITGKASTPRHASDEEKARLYQLQRDLREKSTEWRALTGMEWREGGLTRFLAYEDGDEGGVKTVRLQSPKLWEEHPAMPSPELVELERTVEEMADVTGFYKDSMGTYLLTDIPPTLPAKRVTGAMIFHELTDISRFQASLDFLTGDVKDTELRQVRRQIRKKFSTTRQKRSPQHAEFLALVKQYGPIPRGRGSGAMAFWEAIRQAWHKHIGCIIWANAGAAKRYYERLTKPARKKGVKR